MSKKSKYRLVTNRGYVIERGDIVCLPGGNPDKIAKLPDRTFAGRIKSALMSIEPMETGGFVVDTWAGITLEQLRLAYLKRRMGRKRKLEVWTVINPGDRIMLPSLMPLPSINRRPAWKPWRPQRSPIASIPMPLP